jgi:enoyl-CoA hydratase
MSEFIRFERDGAIAVITIDRPESMNALLPGMPDAIADHMHEFDDDDDLLVAILTASGDKAFCAGGDLKGHIPETTDKGLDSSIADPRERFFSTIRKPIVAAVNGICLAGGMELVLGTDLRVASENATFGVPEARWGLMAVGGGTTRLPQEVTWPRAMELLLMGGRIDAQTALQWGLLNRVVPSAELMTEARTIAEKVCRNGPLAVRSSKASARYAVGRPIEDAFANEFELGVEVFESADAKEGPAAFAEKRDPRFVGR